MVVVVSLSRKAACCGGVGVGVSEVLLKACVLCRDNLQPVISLSLKMESGGGPPLLPGGRGGRGEALRALLAQRQV